ncbi:RES family NAD+ phosphorylase [Marinobacter adhaerens]|uniref:RES family NAD+ phosphorylase n=1 Tax=Marinobacter adhaerens TaxID=1033846 RepID=UPI003D2E7140
MTPEDDELTDDDEKWVCFHCIEESCLSSQIQMCPSQSCSYCGTFAPAWTLQAVAEAIFVVLEEHFQQVSGDSPFTREIGDDVVWAIGSTAEISDEALIEDVRELCEEMATSEMEYYEIPDPGPYSRDSEYIETPIDTYSWSSKWQDFETILKEQSRFFNEDARKILEEIFSDIDTLISKTGERVLTQAGPDTDIPELFRARNFYDIDELARALGSPDEDLGPPPSKYASAGRMNAQGISSFYGSDSPAVCLAEVRPPVGSWVAIASFELIRPINLLNLQLLQNLEHPQGSLFEPCYSNKLSRFQFLRNLTDLIARPVMPQDESTDYLTTQAVADFLSMNGKTNVDGIIFPSVQSPSEGRNIVLFHKSSLVEKRKLPKGTDIYCQSSSFEDDQWVQEFHVFEELPEQSKDDSPTSMHSVGLFPVHHGFPPDPVETREPTLRVKIEELSVHQIKAASFTEQRFDVERTQTTRDKRFGEF